MTHQTKPSQLKLAYRYYWEVLSIYALLLTRNNCSHFVRRKERATTLTTSFVAKYKKHAASLQLSGLLKLSRTIYIFRELLKDKMGFCYLGI